MLAEHTYIMPSTKILLGVLTNNSEKELNQKTADAIDAGSEGDTRHNTAFHSLTVIQQLASAKHIKLLQIEKTAEILPAPSNDTVVCLGHMVNLDLNTIAQATLEAPEKQILVHIVPSIDAMLLGELTKTEKSFIEGSEIIASSEALLARLLIGRNINETIPLEFLDTQANAIILSVSESSLYNRQF